MKNLKLKRRLKRYYYEAKAWYSKIKKSERWFMNYGYSEQPGIVLDKEDEKYRCHMQLYDHILQFVDIGDKDILEISCGKGGGAYYYMKYCKPASITAIDLAKNNISFCKAFCKYSNIEFISANAISFDLGRTFDVIVNLEASHGYGDKESFYKNVAKHLKPGGYFIYADIMQGGSIKSVESAMQLIGLKAEKVEVMNQAVLASMEYNSKVWYPFSTRFPRLIPDFIKNYQASTNGTLYKNLKAGHLKYVSFVFKKE